MLIECPECSAQISNKASTCPHCGFPLKTPPRNFSRSNSKPLRLPNGFGQISKIKNLRKPYRVLVPTGRTADGKYTCKPLKPITYFETYEEAYAALLEYHKDPYDLTVNITMNELYERYIEDYFRIHPNLSSGTKRQKQAAWAYCSKIYDTPLRDLRIKHMKDCIEHGERVYRGKVWHTNDHIKTNIKALFNQMYDYAVEYELIDKNYARSFSCHVEKAGISQYVAKNPHLVFSEEEMHSLWDNLGKVPYVDIVLFQCYTGWRPQELGLLEIANTDLDLWVIKGGMKSDNGRDRLVPIHKNVRKIVQNLYNRAKSQKRKYLINYSRGNSPLKELTYHKYRECFMSVCDTLKLDPAHRPHDPRKHFITTAKENNVNEYILKRIVGHSITDLTEAVYTERSIAQLHNEIDKIP